MLCYQVRYGRGLCYSGNEEFQPEHVLTTFLAKARSTFTFICIASFCIAHVISDTFLSIFFGLHISTNENCDRYFLLSSVNIVS